MLGSMKMFNGARAPISGFLLSLRRAGITSTAGFYATAVDGSGNTYMAGYVGTDSSDATKTHGIVACVNSSGSLVWTRTISQTNPNTVIYDIKYNAYDSKLYICGTSQGKGLVASLWANDGSLVYQKFVDRNSSYTTKYTALNLDTGDYQFAVVGHNNNSSIAIDIFDLSLNLAFYRTVTLSGGSNYQPRSIVKVAGNIYACGEYTNSSTQYGFLVKLDASSSPAWTSGVAAHLQGKINDIVSASNPSTFSDTGVFISGQAIYGGNQRGYIAKSSNTDLSVYPQMYVDSSSTGMSSTEELLGIDTNYDGYFYTNAYFGNSIGHRLVKMFYSGPGGNSIDVVWSKELDINFNNEKQLTHSVSTKAQRAAFSGNTASGGYAIAAVLGTNNTTNGSYSAGGANVTISTDSSTVSTGAFSGLSSTTQTISESTYTTTTADLYFNTSAFEAVDTVISTYTINS